MPSVRLYRRFLIPFAAFLSICLVTPDQDARAESRHDEHHEAENTLVRMERCLRAANRHVPGTVRDLEFGVEKGMAYYEFEIADSKKHVYDVECDARTGRIISTERETRSSDEVFRSQVKIPEKHARKKALKAQPGRVTDTHWLIDDDGNAFYEFEIRTDHDRIVEVDIDAASGEVIAVEGIHHP